MKFNITYLILIGSMFYYQPLASQIIDSAFVSQFNAANSKGKLKHILNLPDPKFREWLPHFSKQLSTIKNNLEKEPIENTKELRLLFSEIEAKKEITGNHPDKALVILENALSQTARNIDDTLACLIQIKDVFIKTKNINRAFEIHHLIEKDWHKRSENGRNYFGANKSQLFHLLGMHKEAIVELRKEFNASPNKSDTSAIINFHNSLGVYFNQQKNSDSARSNLLKAKTLLYKKVHPIEENQSIEFYKGLVDGNIALSYFNEGRFKEAIPLLKNDIYYSVKSSNYQSAFNSYHLIAKCYLQTDKAKLALEYADTANTLLDDKIKDLNLKKNFLPTLAECHLKNRNYEKASELYKAYYYLNDSIVKSENESLKLNQGLAFSLNQRELAIKEENKRMQEAQLEEAREKNFRISVLAGLLILLIIIFFLSANNRRIKMREKQLFLKNDQIQSQNNQIEQSLKEKEALIKEIHHRVKNNLQIINSMLNLQVGRIDDEKTELIFFEARQRINAIALTHQMLYQRSTISEVNLKEYIESLVKQIEASLSSTKIKIVTDLNTDEETLTIDGAVPLGLIINELLTNSYKHAFPVNKVGTITVSLLSKEHSLLVKVSDNGVGLPKDFKLEETRSLGMELILILIEQLDSKLIVENQNGSTFMFELKKHSTIERS